MLTITGAEVTSVKIGSSTVNEANYTVVGNKVTLKKPYLATLAEGEKTFTLYTKTTSITVKVTIQDTTV